MSSDHYTVDKLKMGNRGFVVKNLICPERGLGVSLVVQWLRIHLPMQKTLVWSLLGELRSHVPRGNQAQVLQTTDLYTQESKDQN